MRLQARGRDPGSGPGTAATRLVGGLAVMALLCGCGGGGGGPAGNGSASAPAVSSPNASRSGATSVTVHLCTPKPKADATDPCWKNATATPLANLMAGAMPSGFAATFKAAWDMTNLYVMEDVTAPEGFAAANANTTSPWTTDAMEIYLSSDNGSDTAMGANDTQLDISIGDPSTVWVFPGQDGTGVTGYVTSTATGWTAMMTVPWSTVGVTAGTGQLIGLDPAVDAYTDGSTQNQLLAWGTPGSGEQNPSIWGQLVLQK